MKPQNLDRESRLQTDPIDADPTDHRMDRRGFIALGGGWLCLAWAVPLATLASACGGGAEDESGGSGAAEKSAGSQGSPAAAPLPQPAKRQAQAETEAKADMPSEDALVTEIPAMESLVKSINYTHQSPKPDQTCANCMLYEAQGSGLGTCKLFAQGLVKAEGWCTSWIKKAATG